MHETLLDHLALLKDTKAINALLSGLPIQLHDGSIASIVARIPWPNPLTSNVGFSLHSLNLIFHLVPTSPNVQHSPVVDLSSSVASIAESFVHGELSPREERFLRESVHVDYPSLSPHQSKDESSNVPGSIDPFLSAEDEEFQSETDPEGVSIFASLIERLLARFEFDALDTRITLIHPGRASFTATIAEIRYTTESNGVSGQTGSSDVALGESGVVSISGVSVTARNLHQPIPPYPPTPSSISTLPAIDPGYSSHVDSPLSHSPRSRSSSSSSLDEETQLLMSQSILSLPPRPPSPASSLASSLYQSATSDAPAVDTSISDLPSRGGESSSHMPASLSQQDFALPLEDPSDVDGTEVCETILSITSNPIVIRLTTPSPDPHPGPPTPLVDPGLPAGQPPTQRHTNSKVCEKLQLSGELGTITCVFRAWQIRRILDLSESWTSHVPLKSSIVPEPPAAPTSPAEGPANSLGSISMGLEARLSVRHVVIILLPSCASDDLQQSRDLPSMCLGDQFFAQPLSPPNLRHGYIRGLFEGLSLSVTLDTPNPDEGSLSQRKSDAARHQRGTTSGIPKNTMLSTFSIFDVSVLSFRKSSLASGSTMLASPILVTDRYLPSQYPAAHVHPDFAGPTTDDLRASTYPSLPTFDVVDWTTEKHQGNGHKLSTWRCKPKRPRHQQQRREKQDVPTVSDGGDKQPSQLSSPAIHVIVQRVIPPTTKSRIDAVDAVEATLAPLHIFADLELLLSHTGVSAFLDDILDSSSGNDSGGRPGLDKASSHEGDPTSEPEDVSTPPASPGLLDENSRAKERLRLEKLVLHDMEVDDDYPQKMNIKHTLKSGRKVLDQWLIFHLLTVT